MYVFLAVYVSIEFLVDLNECLDVLFLLDCTFDGEIAFPPCKSVWRTGVRTADNYMWHSINFAIGPSNLVPDSHSVFSAFEKFFDFLLIQSASFGCLH